VVFSVREAESEGLYQRAAAQAWAAIETRLEQLAVASPDRKFELVEVSYDPLSGESLIEELPDQPKSSRPQAVEVSVHLWAIYELRDANHPEGVTP
jgi:hypothetical protein